MPPTSSLIDQVRGSMEIEKMLDADFQRSIKVAPSEQDVQRYYPTSTRTSSCRIPARCGCRTSRSSCRPTRPMRKKPRGMKQIIKLRDEATKAKDFAWNLRKNSQDASSAAKGGDLGYFTKGQLPPVVDQLAFSTPLGQVSQVLESNIGFSFLKVTDRRGASYAPLTSVKAKIALVLLDFNQEYIVKNMLKGLAKDAKIKFTPTPEESGSGQAS